MHSEATRGSRRGTTLLELLLCMVILGIMASVAVPLIRSRTPSPPLTPQLRVAIARRSALETGLPVTIDWTGDSGSARPVTVWPDGRVTADSAPSIERITGMADTAFVRRNHLQHWVAPERGR